MEDEVISLAGNIFMVKGNNVEVFSSMGLSKFDPSKELIEGTTPHRIKELLDKGYELAVDDGAEKGQAFKKAINNANVMPGTSYMNFSGDTGNKLLRNVKSIGSGLGKILPSIAGFSTPIGAIASGLLYAGTSKPAGANTALEPYEGVYSTRSILDTPITPANRDLYDQAGVDTSLGPMDRDSGFDRYMQNKIQNQQNTQGIMGVKANRERTSSRVGPQGNIRAYGLKRGGIASL